MIEFTTGDVLKADAEALVNTVNCVGVMGRGVALQFRKAYPDNYRAYVAACERQDVQPGRMFVVETGKLTNPRYIINFPTKRHWRAKSRLEDIDAGLTALVEEVRQRSIRSVALPPLGSGLGGLHWPDVKRRITEALSAVPDVRVTVYEPIGPPDPKTIARFTNPPSMTLTRAAMVRLLAVYQHGLMDPFVSLLEVHKLMYFLHSAGKVPTLAFVKGRYGPYAEKLRHVLTTLEGHWISGYGDGGDQPEKPIELLLGAETDADVFLAQHPEAQASLDRIADLVQGFETPFGLELLATVHWVVTQEGATTPDDAVRLVHGWSARKRKRFSPSQIRLTWDILHEKGWLPPVAGA